MISSNPCKGLEFRVLGSGFRAQRSGLRVQGSGFRVQGSGCRVHGSGVRVPREAPVVQYHASGLDVGREHGARVVTATTPCLSNKAALAQRRQ